jgi:hypothetical protein
MVDHDLVPSDGLRVALVAVAAVSVTFGASRAAHADVRVERSADAESCPDPQSFRERVRDGGGASVSDSKSAEITVRFERVGDGYRSLVRVAEAEPRSLVDDAPNCDGLAEATALAVKLLLDLEAARPALVVGAPPKPAPVAPVSEPVPARPAEPRVRTLGELSVSGMLSFGLVSPVASGLRAGAAVVLDSHERWTLGLTGLVLPASAMDIGEGTVHVSLQGGGVEGCRRARVGRSVLLALCSRFEAMRFEGESRGFDRTERQARGSLSGSLLARARTRVAGPVAVFVELGGIVPFLRQRFTIDTIGFVYDPPPAAGTAGIGLAFDFE